LLDETGHLIARSLVATNLGDGTAQVTEHISGVLLAGGTLPASYRDTRGVLVLGAYYSLPAEDWTVLVEQQYRASMAPVAVVLTWLTGLLVIMLAAGYGAARSLGVRLERPIHDSVDAINDTLQRLSSTIAQQASGAQEQAAAVNQVSTTMDELSRTAQEIARATGETLASAEKGNKAYQASLESMSTVSERVGVAAQHILALGEKRRRIGEVSSIISGIAEQIHLLSLNAAIEAAGAGEYGRRFAVVATQVKELAAATRQSSNEVRQLVDEISNSTSSTIMVTEQATHQVAVTSSLTDEAQTELDAIVQRIQAISSATQQQQVANAEVVSAMHGVSDVAQQSAQGAQDVAQSTEELIASMMSLRAILAGK
jgi:methyl-accepting chemotaxis protein